MLKAILFDLDDTLIDWSGFQGNWDAISRRSLQRVFNYIQEAIHPLDDEETFVQVFNDLTRLAWFKAQENLLAPHLGSVLVETAVALGAPADAPGLTAQQCLQAHEWQVIEGTRIFPEVIDVLTLLQESGIKVGIVTNAFQPMWMRDIEMRDLGLLDFFPECRFSAADVGYLKPHRKIFELALECLDVQPEHTVFIGDSPDADIAGAQAAGLRAILRRVSHPQPMSSGLIVPDHQISNLSELPQILDGWYPGWRS